MCPQSSRCIRNDQRYHWYVYYIHLNPRSRQSSMRQNRGTWFQRHYLGCRPDTGSASVDSAFLLRPSHRKVHYAYLRRQSRKCTYRSQNRGSGHRYPISYNLSPSASGPENRNSHLSLGTPHHRLRTNDRHQNRRRNRCGGTPGQSFVSR